MDAEKKQEFTRRISQSNRSGLVVVQYDILYAYMEEAKAAHDAGDYEGFKTAVRKGDRVLVELSETLNFRYALSGQLYSLYSFARRALMQCMVKNSCQGIEDAKKALDPLRSRFVQVAAQDTSEPLMQNTQQVYAGITYGKQNLQESFQEPDTSRGFFA